LLLFIISFKLIKKKLDYMGFRLQALSLLPINSSTLIYGTADAGKLFISISYGWLFLKKNN
jgi:hypothetical protein